MKEKVQMEVNEERTSGSASEWLSGRATQSSDEDVK